MTPKHPPIIIFDFDGVLLPSTGANIAITNQFNDPKYKWNKKALENFQAIDLIRRIERVDKDSNFEMAYGIFISCKDILPRVIDRIRFLLTLQQNFRKAEYKYAEFFPYVIPTLKKLAKKTIIGICTNSEEKRIRRWLDHYSLGDLVAAFTSRNDRKQYGVKPDPRILLYTIWKIKQEKNLGKIDRSLIFFLGDNVSDVLTAKNAEVKSVAVLSGNSTLEELSEASPDYIIQTLEEIFSIPDLSEIFS